jgi:hypothetical protein
MLSERVRSQKVATGPQVTRIISAIRGLIQSPENPARKYTGSDQAKLDSFHDGLSPPSYSKTPVGSFKILFNRPRRDSKFTADLNIGQTLRGKTQAMDHTRTEARNFVRHERRPFSGTAISISTAKVLTRCRAESRTGGAPTVILIRGLITGPNPR